MSGLAWAGAPKGATDRGSLRTKQTVKGKGLSPALGRRHLQEDELDNHAEAEDEEEGVGSGFPGLVPLSPHRKRRAEREENQRQTGSREGQRNRNVSLRQVLHQCVDLLPPPLPTPRVSLLPIFKTRARTHSYTHCELASSSASNHDSPPRILNRPKKDRSKRPKSSGSPSAKKFTPMIASAAHGGAASPAALCSAPLGRRNRRALLTDYRRGEEEDHGVGDGHDGFGDGEDDLLHRLDLAEEPAERVAASPSSRAHALRDRAARELFRVASTRGRRADLVHTAKRLRRISKSYCFRRPL